LYQHIGLVTVTLLWVNCGKIDTFLVWYYLTQFSFDVHTIG